ncbi:hypothetical protein Tco_1115356 [Tanacetum coccineum]
MLGLCLPQLMLAHLVDTDTELDPEEAPSEAKELQSLGSRVPLMGEEFEAFETIGTPIHQLYQIPPHHRHQVIHILKFHLPYTYPSFIPP